MLMTNKLRTAADYITRRLTGQPITQLPASAQHGIPDGTASVVVDLDQTGDNPHRRVLEIVVAPDDEYDGSGMPVSHVRMTYRVTLPSNDFLRITIDESGMAWFTKPTYDVCAERWYVFLSEMVFKLAQNIALFSVAKDVGALGALDLHAGATTYVATLNPIDGKIAVENQLGDPPVINGLVVNGISDLEPWGADEIGYERADSALAEIGLARVTEWLKDGDCSTCVVQAGKEITS